MRKRLLPSFLVLLAVTALAQVPQSTALPTKHASQLKKLKMGWLVPTYLPAGFKFKSMNIQDTKTPLETWGGISYANDQTHAKITLQFASDGLGDIFFTDDQGETYEPTARLKFRAIFGSGVLEQAKNSHLNQTVMQWMKLSGKRYPRFVSAIAERVSLSEMKKVVESLRPIK